MTDIARLSQLAPYQTTLCSSSSDTPEQFVAARWSSQTASVPQPCCRIMRWPHAAAPEEEVVTSSRSPAFLATLPITAEEADGLRQFGSDTPEQLLAQIKAAPDAFRRFLGSDRAQVVESALERLVQGPPSAFAPAEPGPLGVPLGTPPRELPAATVDLQRRDELFALIQRLKREGAPAGRIAAAEQDLDALLDALPDGPARPAPGQPSG